MENAWPAIAACAGIISLLPVLARLRRGVRGTALESAWPCAAVVWVAWLAVALLTIADRVSDHSSLHAWLDVLWYGTAILALTPPVAVLGARRPTARVWTIFVLIPLVLIFIWPVLPVMRTAGGPAAFSVESPVLVGFILVLVMGAGNYLGLRFSPSALLWIAGLLLIVLTLCPATSEWVAGARMGRALGTLCVVASAWLADRQAARAHAPGTPLDRVWRDFRDLFGIVWARRIQERFNDEAAKQGMPLRLGFDGLEEADPVRCRSRAPTQTALVPAESADRRSPGPFDARALAAAETSLRWLLQKFVDREWIDQRFNRSRISVSSS